MRRCNDIQEALTEAFAFGGSERNLSPADREHLEGCAECLDLMASEVEMNRLLAEPTPLVPAELVPNVLTRIAEEERIAMEGVGEFRPEVVATEPNLLWTERLLWAASGAAAMYGLERLPNLSSEIWVPTQAFLTTSSTLLEGVFSLNSLTLLVLTLVLIAAQLGMVYRVRINPS